MSTVTTPAIERGCIKYFSQSVVAGMAWQSNMVAGACCGHLMSAKTREQTADVGVPYVLCPHPFS